MTQLRLSRSVFFLLIEVLMILMSGLASVWVDSILFNIFVMIFCASRLHALGVLMHEGVHFNIANQINVNDFISNWLAGYFLLLPIEKYRLYHFSHHQKPFSTTDMEWTHKSQEKAWNFPMPAIQFAQFLLKGPYYQWRLMPLRFKSFFLEFKSKLSCKIFSILFIIAFWNFPQFFLLCWFLPLFFMTPIFTRIRSLAEHYPVKYNQDPQKMARDFNPALWEKLLFFPYNITFHKIHHLHPHIPFYKLNEKVNLELNQRFFGFHPHSIIYQFIK